LRESEDDSLARAGCAGVAIFHLDPLGNVAVEYSAEHLKGYRAEEILGKHFSVFYPPEEVSIGSHSIF